ncbi:MAG: hypothetical protein A2Y73_06140 [Chloroflexi bacterium RBG_13_56_8]|nr:MAG: hypothetical protein A2Y73_06140 [Chloroflexi bacterium RBG_13_56_8]
MAAESRGRAQGMELSEFHRYLDEKRRELEACYHEIEEVQYQFNDIFQRELAAWQEKFTYCYPRVMEQRGEMPPAFAQIIDQTEREELARITAEIAELDGQIREGRSKSDSLLSQAREATAALRGVNPDLNEREEHLKSLMMQYQDEYADAYEKLEALEDSSLGWLTNFSRIRRLRKAQRLAKRQQAQTLEQLREVRQDWLGKVEEAGEKQAALRDEWQKVSVQVSEAETRREYLQTNLTELAQEAAIQRTLEELEKPPEISGELGDALADLVKRNEVRRSYEEGLRAVAEALGLLKGVGEGMNRFQQSVGTVLQEQRRYSLKQVQVPVPGWIVQMNETWQELSAKVKDEKYMGTHPLEFSRVVDGYIKERLTDQRIQSFFEEMGQALSEATSAWD